MNELAEEKIENDVKEDVVESMQSEENAEQESVQVAEPVVEAVVETVSEPATEEKSIFDPSNFNTEQQEKPKQVEPAPKVVEDQKVTSIPENFFERMKEVERENSTLRAEKEQLEANQKAEVVEARKHFLMNKYGMKSEAYLKVADDAVPDADPRTEQGEEQFRNWAIKHPELFESAPQIPTIKEEEIQNDRGIYATRHKTWKDVFKKR